MPEHRIFSTKFSSVYPLYVQKAERKGRTKAEVDRIVCWLTGYGERDLQLLLQKEVDFRTFFAEAPAIHPPALNFPCKGRELHLVPLTNRRRATSVAWVTGDAASTSRPAIGGRAVDAWMTAMWRRP